VTLRPRFFVQCDQPFTWEGIIPSGGTLFSDDSASAQTISANQLNLLISNGVPPLFSLEGPGGFVTNGFVTIAGGGAIPTPPYAVGGFTAYMIGIRSDLGPTSPTVVIQCTGSQPHIFFTDGVDTQLLVIKSDGAFASILDSSAAALMQLLAGGTGLFLDADNLHMRNLNGSSPYTAGDWAGAAPTTLQQAINRMSALLKTLHGAPIP